MYWASETPAATASKPNRDGHLRQRRTENEERRTDDILQIRITPCTSPNTITTNHKHNIHQPPQTNKSDKSYKAATQNTNAHAQPHRKIQMQPPAFGVCRPYGEAGQLK